MPWPDRFLEKGNIILEQWEILYYISRKGLTRTVKRSDKTWSTGNRNGNPLHYSCLKKPMDSMKRQKAMTPEDEPPAQKVSNMLLGNTGGQLLIAPERIKHLGQSINYVQ